MRSCTHCYVEAVEMPPLVASSSLTLMKCIHSMLWRGRALMEGAAALPLDSVGGSRKDETSG